jgi:secreted Zn-dependent insulinase-like peptidase
LREYKLSLITNMIELFWGNFFYYHLRTLKQLGYVVNAAKTIINNVMVVY